MSSADVRKGDQVVDVDGNVWTVMGAENGHAVLRRYVSMLELVRLSNIGPHHQYTPVASEAEAER